METATQKLIKLRSLPKEKLAAYLLSLEPAAAAELDFVLTRMKEDELEAKCGQLAVDYESGYSMPVAREDAGVLYWLQNVTMTEDDHWLAKGTPHRAPFPKKSYFRYLIGAMLEPLVHPKDSCQSLYIPKARQMLTSLSACGLITWMCQFRPSIFWVAQAGTEAKALELSRYVKFLYENQPLFLRQRNPLVKDSTTEKIWKNGSRFLAVPGGQNQIRGLHPYGYLSDESAFQPEFSECINAVLPVAKTIVAISTGNPGPFADACSV